MGKGIRSLSTTLENGFQGSQFTTVFSSRTAVGVNGEGKLVLVSVPRATIQQMREVMLALGCVDAFTLDGGASCGCIITAPTCLRRGGS